jgi:hypothetical protein
MKKETFVSTLFPALPLLIGEEELILYKRGASWCWQLEIVSLKCWKVRVVLKWLGTVGLIPSLHLAQIYTVVAKVTITPLPRYITSYFFGVNF